MTKQEFQDGMNTIQTDVKNKEAIWKQLNDRQMQTADGISGRQLLGRRQRNGKFSFWKTLAPVMAVMLICVIVIPGFVYADEIVNYFRGHLSQNPKLASNVDQNVFQDGDEHVSMEVSELLSDGYATCMTVKYTALDKKGKKWLFGETLRDAPSLYRLDGRNLQSVLGIEPIDKESGEELVATGDFGTEEIESERTEMSRVFSLIYNLSDASSQQLRLHYPLFDQRKNKELTVKNLLKTYLYELDGTCSNENYTPRYLRISKMKYTVYGENHGVYQKSGPNYEMLSEEEINSAVLHFKQHSSLDLIGNGPGYFYMGAVDPSDSNCQMDLSVLSGEFYGEAEWIVDEEVKKQYGKGMEKRIDHRLAVDPEDVETIEINGDVYQLNLVE